MDQVNVGVNWISGSKFKIIHNCSYSSFPPLLLFIFYGISRYIAITALKFNHRYIFQLRFQVVLCSFSEAQKLGNEKNSHLKFRAESRQTNKDENLINLINKLKAGRRCKSSAVAMGACPTKMKMLILLFPRLIFFYISFREWADKWRGRKRSFNQMKSSRNKSEGFAPTSPIKMW